jgi:Ca-activated chloride channel family protein
MFHFAHNAWLWGLLAIPIVALLYALLYRPSAYRARLEQFADSHLLPHLLTGNPGTGGAKKRSLLLWSMVWACGIIALAEPRWNYTDLETFKPEQNLVVLLDLSKSMDAQDVKPSRMAQAREKLEDLLKMAKGMNIGLVGYAADAHMISPITDDAKPLLDLLPEIDTSLPYVQGNILKPALDMASRMLDAEPGHNKSILVISDGGFRDGNIASMAAEAVKPGIAIYTIGIGTPEGAPIPAEGGGFIKAQDEKIVISRLQGDRLQALSNPTGGLYRKANYTDSDILAILNQIDGKSEAAEATGHKTRYWEEHFYIPVLIMALLILPWFRRGFVFPVLAFLCFSTVSGGNASAASLQDMFLNNAQQAQQSYSKGDYKSAATKFDTPYRRGVAEYKAGQFPEAEKSFASAGSTAPAARYNLGNAQVMQGKYEDAIASYETVLKQEPHNTNASHNLEIARKLLQLQKQQQQDKNKESNQQQKDQKPSEQQKSSSGKQQGQNSASSKQEDDPKKDEGKQQSGKGKEQASRQPESSAQAQQQKQQGQGVPQNSQTQPQPQNTAQAKSGDEKKQSSSPNPVSIAQAQQKELQAARSDKKEDAASSNARKNKGDEEAGTDRSAAIAGQEHPRAQKDIDADQWLNRIENDPKSFLKNQFQVETQNNGTAQGDEPW